MFVLLVASALVLAPSCNRGTNGTDAAGSGGGESAETSAPPADLPRVLVIGPGDGPALYVGSDDEAPAFGYVNPGVSVRLESGIQDGRAEVLLAGPLPTRGWVPVDRLAAYTQQRGRVEGTPFYVGPNDLVTVLGAAADEGQMRIAVRPWLGGQRFLESRVGTFDAALLAHLPVDAASVEAPTEGRCFRVPARQTVPVYDRPDGRPVASIPAQEPPASVVVLRERAPWYGVRIGYGPYVIGYVQIQLTPCDGPRPAPEPMAPASAGEAPYWMAQEQGDLYRVAAGTRVAFGRDADGRPRIIARLREEGWARDLGRPGGDQVDAFIAVNDDVALRGLVPASALTRVEWPQEREQVGGHRVIERVIRGNTEVGAPARDGTGPGVFDSNAVVRLLQLRQSTIRRCYERQLRDDPRLRGRVVARFTIELDGTISGVTATENTTGSPALAGCVIYVVSGLRFNPGPAGGPVTYSFPFVFGVAP